MGDIVAYQVDLNFPRSSGKTRDFETGPSPANALDEAKGWLKSETQAYLQDNPSIATPSWWDAGTITATFVDEAADNEPAATLRVRRVTNANEFDWAE